jgi:beta-galactosidase
VIIKHNVKCVGKMPEWLPKIGLQLTLADSLTQFQWCGRGPFETYPDRKTGAKVGVYSGTVDEQYEPYLIPQDHGNKTDVRWAALTDETGDGLFVSGNLLLNVSVHKYSTDNLTRALYPFQLVPQTGITLNVDHRVSGVGGTPIKTLKKYRVLPGEFTYRVRLRPFSNQKTKAGVLHRQGVLSR